jgi:signal peptidase I
MYRPVVNKVAYALARPQRGDIAVFTPPVPVSAPFIKRVVAVPGDRFRMEHGAAYVNGHAVKEPYINQAADYALIVKNYGISEDSHVP